MNEIADEKRLNYIHKVSRQLINLDALRIFIEEELER